MHCVCIHYYEIILIYCITFIGNILTVILLRNHVYLHFVVLIHFYFFKKFCSVYGGGNVVVLFLTLALGRDWVLGGKIVWCALQRILIGLLSVGTWWQGEKSLPLLKTKLWSWVNSYIVVFDRKIKQSYTVLIHNRMHSLKIKGHPYML
jgi:hypothetical protein